MVFGVLIVVTGGLTFSKLSVFCLLFALGFGFATGGVVTVFLTVGLLVVTGFLTTGGVTLVFIVSFFMGGWLTITGLFDGFFRRKGST